jgi:hypothetical protein
MADDRWPKSIGELKIEPAIQTATQKGELPRFAFLPERHYNLRIRIFSSGYLPAVDYTRMMTRI